MKNSLAILLSLCFSITLISCTSDEEKVQELIKNEMFRTLFDYASYEPIETKIDSAFSSKYDNIKVLAYASVIEENNTKKDELLKIINDDISTAEIYAGSYSSYSKARAKRALDRAQENLNLTKEYNAQNRKYQIEIKKISDTFNSKFIGWRAIHKFRCKNKGGNYDIGNFEYIINQSFDSIVSSKNLDDEDMNNYKKLIDQALEMKIDTTAIK